MPNPKLIGLIGLLLISLSPMQAQENPGFRFGKVSPGDFSIPPPSFDSGAHAIIIGDIGKSIIRPNNKGRFNYEFYRKMRVKILDANGIDAGIFSFPIYLTKGSSSKESVTSLKASTYNLEGGKVIETKLDNDQVFTEKQNTYLYYQKFSLPALKAGAIFEISYKIESDFIYYFRPWVFQHSYPCLWSEYETEVPEYFEYDIFEKGDHPYSINSKKKDARSFNVAINAMNEDLNNMETINTVVNVNRWLKVNVPSLHEENYVASLDNYRNKIEFQIAAVNLPYQTPRTVTQSWKKVSKDLLEDEDFGSILDKNNNWLDDDLKVILGNSNDLLEKAKIIHAYIRDNFIVISRNSIYPSTGLKTVSKTKKGNVADINLLLITMLKHEKINCVPIILSTRPNGLPNKNYPVIIDYNYVACIANIDNSQYFLDASSKDIPFGKLDIECFNGQARMINPEGGSINLSADSIVDNNMTFAIMIPEKNILKGKVSSNAGLLQSTSIRRQIAKVGQKNFNDALKTNFGPDVEVSDVKIDSLAQINEPIKIEYEINFKVGEDDLFYINPVLSPFFRENPFYSTQRKYAIEMPSRIDWTYVLNLSIPAGYGIEEMPKSEKVKFNENEGMFEYIISKNEETIQLKTRLLLRKANFLADDYENIRDFFSYIIKKQSEQIVLKKK